MNAAFEHAELGNSAGFRERSEEYIRDEEAWLRMEDEGCPNGRQSVIRQEHYQAAV